jgi:hypothetical protein
VLHCAGHGLDALFLLDSRPKNAERVTGLAPRSLTLQSMSDHWRNGRAANQRLRTIQVSGQLSLLLSQKNGDKSSAQ